MLSKKVFKSGYDVSKGSDLAQGEKNDCFVRACANAFNTTYEVAHRFVSENFNRKKGQGTKGCLTQMKKLKNITLPQTGQLDLFESNGGERNFTIKHVGDMPKMGGNLINRKYKHKKVAFTVKEFIQKFKTGTYLLLVNKHALTVKNGVMIDNGNYQYGGYRRVVESAFIIE